MGLRWNDAHDGSPHQLAYRGQHLLGQVAYYDVVNGGGPGWVGFVHGERVTGRCLAPDVARRAVEDRSGSTI